jgi:hypothetical protein
MKTLADRKEVSCHVESEAVGRRKGSIAALKPEEQLRLAKEVCQGVEVGLPVALMSDGNKR